MEQFEQNLEVPIPLGELPNRPLVTTLITNYNYGRFVTAAIDSVFHQTYQNCEVIVCDDGSTDDSRQILQRYASRDGRLLVVEKENGGLASALNKAFSVSHGDIICLLDADDLFMPEKLSMIVESYRRDPRVGLVAHPVIQVDENMKKIGVLPTYGKISSGWFGDRLRENLDLFLDFPPMSGITIRREVAQVVFPLNQRFRANADSLLIKLAALVTAVHGTREPGSLRRVHGANLTFDSSKVTVKALEEYLNLMRGIKAEQTQFMSRVGLPVPHPSAGQESLPELFARCRVARMSGQDGWKSYLKRITAHKEFRSWPAVRRAFWVMSKYMPSSLFLWALAVVKGESRFSRAYGLLKLMKYRTTGSHV